MENLKVLFIARHTSKQRTLSGMGLSAGIITGLLKEAGCTVIAEDASSDRWYAGDREDVDVVWFYEDTYIDTDKLIKLGRIYSASVPVMFNSMFTNTSQRLAVIRGMLEEFRKAGCGNIYAGTFTEAARDAFGEDRAHTFAMPKTIKKIAITPEAYEQRSGILLGEFNKMLNTSLTGSLDMYPVVKALKDNFPDISLKAYRHYIFEKGHRLSIERVNKRNTPEEIQYITDNVEIIEYTDKLPELVNSVRIYVSTVNSETFAMVPAEAQATGVCVMYRHMPQSLSSHLNYTGYMWEGPDDLVNAVRRIYYNKEAWESMSRLSLFNYRACNSESLAHIMRLQLEKLVINHRTRGSGQK